MDRSYIEALRIGEDALSKINSIYRNAKTESFEDNKGCAAIEKLIEDLEDFTKTINYYSKNTKEGHLKLSENDRYILYNREFSCGNPIEIYNTEYQEWESGRVEHSSKYGGYYFYNNDGENIALSEGMKARIRI